MQYTIQYTHSVSTIWRGEQSTYFVYHHAHLTVTLKFEIHGYILKQTRHSTYHHSSIGFQLIPEPLHVGAMCMYMYVCIMNACTQMKPKNSMRMSNTHTHTHTHTHARTHTHTHMHERTHTHTHARTHTHTHTCTHTVHMYRHTASLCFTSACNDGMQKQTHFFRIARLCNLINTHTRIPSTIPLMCTNSQQHMLITTIRSTVWQLKATEVSD